MGNEDTLNPNSSDHDILTELRTEFRLFNQQYNRDMSEVKDGWQKVTTDHELRLQKIEKVVADTQLDDKVKRLVAAEADIMTLKQNMRDFFVGAKTARWFVGFFTAILGSILTLLLSKLLTGVLFK